MAASLSTRLETTARALAQLLASGQITLDQLRPQMARAIAEAHTVALLAGTGGQRNTEIDTALREIVADEQAELDRLITLLERGTVEDVERRLLAFADTLNDTRNEGQRIIERRDLSPLIPLGVGSVLAALTSRLSQQPSTTTQQLPRIDSRQLRAVGETLGNRLDALADELAAGNLTPDQWHEAMQRELQIIHRTYAQLGGGQVNGQRLNDQLDFLDGFRADVEGLSPEQVKRRARMYIGSGQATMQEAATAQIGMPPLPAWPKSGTSRCLSNCKCWWRFETLDEPGGWDCFWTLRPSETCQECDARSKEWNPLRIRNGIIQPYNPVGLFT